MAMIREYLDSFPTPASGSTNSNATLQARGWTVVNNSSVSIQSQNTDTGGYEVRRTSGNTFYMYRSLTGNYASMSLRVRIAHSRSSANGESLLAVRDAGTIQLDVQVPNSGGDLVVRRGGSTTLLTASGAIIDDNEHDIELVFKIHGSTGFVQLYVDGISVGAVSGANTQQSANAYVNEVRLGHESSASFSVGYRDLRVYRDDGGADASALGPSFVYVRPLTGDGSEQDWSPSSGSDGYAMVDEVGSDGDATYLESSTDMDRATFTGPPVAGTVGQVLGAQVVAIARKTDGSARNLILGVISGANEDQGSAQALTSNYAPYFFPFTDKPGGSALVPSDITNLELSIEADQ